MSENLETPLRLNAIRIIGAKVTRPSFLSAIFAPYLPVLPSASYLSSDVTPSEACPQTLRSLLASTRDLSALLSRYDIFTQVDASLESPESVRAEKEDVDIVLRVKEVPRFYLKTATDVGDGEGSAVRRRHFPFSLSLSAILMQVRRLDGDCSNTEHIWRSRNARRKYIFRHQDKIGLPSQSTASNTSVGRF